MFSIDESDFVPTRAIASGTSRYHHPRYTPYARRLGGTHYLIYKDDADLYT